jgi:hypothetical protein
MTLLLAHLINVLTPCLVLGFGYCLGYGLIQELGLDNPPAAPDYATAIAVIFEADKEDDTPALPIIPDPWELPAPSLPITQTAPVPPLPTMKLLPPAQPNPLTSLPVTKLRALAKKAGIAKYYKLSKTELIAVLA